MTLWDYLDIHPWWALVYLCVFGLWTTLGVGLVAAWIARPARRFFDHMDLFSAAAVSAVEYMKSVEKEKSSDE